MANGEMKAKLVLQASAQGDEEIIKLRGELDKTAGSADKAAPEFAELAAEINKLGEQRAVIAEFERLKTITTDTAARLQQLQQATREAALALKEKQAALTAANAAEQTQSNQLAQARAQQKAMGEAIKQLAAELKAMSQEAKASGDSSAAMTQKLAEGQAQLALLKAEYKSAAANVSALAQAHRDGASAAKEAQQQTTAAQKQFDGLRQSTAQAKQALASQNQELQRARDALSAMGMSSKALADAQAQTNKGLDATRESLAALAKKAEEAASVLANRELLGVRAHADVQKEIDKTRQAYEQLKASGKLTHTELAQAAMKTEERVRELQQSTNGWKESLGKAKMEFAAMAASGAGLAVVAKKAIDFESAMSGVAKVTNATEAQMKELEAQIKEMTRTIPLAATELAAMAAAGGQLGVPIAKLREFVDLAATMATAFNMSAEQAGQAVAKLSNIFSMPIEQVRALGDAINTLGNNTAAREADIVEVLTRIGGTAKQFGLSAQQAAALATAMLSLGTSAEVAGTGISAILSKLQTAGIQSKEFQQALGSIGVSAVQLSKDIRDNPQKALTEFLNTLSKLEGGKQAEVLAQLFGLEYQDDVARLLAGLDGYRKALGLVGDAAKTAGAMQKEFEARAKTTAAQLTLLKNAADEVGINLGSVFLPVINQVSGGLKTATLAIADFAKEFPIISAVAASLTVAAASAGALGIAFGAARMAGTAAVSGLVALMPGLTGGLLAAATSAGALRVALGALGGVAASLFVGVDIGTKLKKEFLEVELAGIALAGSMTKVGAAYQTAWEIIKAPFNTDTIEAAQERLRGKLAQIDNEYAALADSAVQAREAQKGQAQAADAAAQANAKASAAVQAVATKMQELATSAKAAGQGAQVASTQLEQVFAQAIKGASSVAVVAQLRDKLQEAQAAGQLTADAAARLRVQLDQVGAAKGVQEMSTEFDTLKKNAEGVQGAVDKLVATLKFDDKGSIAAFAKMLEQLGSTGVLSARQVDAAWQEALGKLSTQQLNEFSLAVKVAFAQGTISAKEFAQVNEQVLTASFEKLGVNAAQALGKISTGAKDAIGSIDMVADSAKAAGVGVQDAARSIEMAFAAAIPKADSLQAIDALEQKLKAMGAAGQISAQGLERTQIALDKQRATIEAQIPGIQSMEEALRSLGVTPQKELEALATSAKQAFEAVRASGTATPREINEAWKAMAEASIAANNGVADASLKAQAQQYGMVIETDKAGKAIVKSMAEAEGATKAVGDAAKASAKSLEELAQAGWDATKDMVTQAREHNAALAKLEGSWLNAEAAASEYAEQMAKVVWDATKSVRGMQEEHARLVGVMETLKEQQRQLENQSNGAANGVDDLRLRLLELEGTEEDIGRARHEREEQEVRRKMAMLRIDLQRAEINKDGAEVQRLEKELGLLAEQLTLLDRIYEKERAQRQKKERERQQDEQERQRQQDEQERQRKKDEQDRKQDEKDRQRQDRDGGSNRVGNGGDDGGSSWKVGGNGGWAQAPAPRSGPPINITLNANGINDPVKLARMLEPELKRLAALAR